MIEVHADAPGRVNLIGEHTDYQDGYVMPCAIPQRTHVSLRPRGNREVHARSAEEHDRPVQFDLGLERRRGDWGDYVQGVVVALRARGYTVDGFEMSVRSEVPVGSGLSSSAALEVALLRGLRRLFTLPLDDVEIARVGQRAEVDFVGAPVGIMDQMACSLAGEREALFLDTRSLEFTRIPLPPSLDLVVIDSGIKHRHAGGEYAQRRAESEAAARALGVATLRDLDGTNHLACLSGALARRATHIVTENARVLAARESLEQRDLRRFGQLLNDSHASLRDAYEVSVPGVDALVEIAQSDHWVYGARMTGGGFGGAVIIAAHQGRGGAVAARVAERYQLRTGRLATVLIPRTSVP